MDIEYQNTPPKKPKRSYQFSTPNRKTTPKDTETPKKSRITFHSPLDQPNTISTPTKNALNQKSKKDTKNSSNSPQTPYKLSPAQKLSQEYDERMNNKDNQKELQVSPFFIPRLEINYQFIRYLGLGNFSKVALYQSRLTQEQYAIKSTEICLMSINQVQALSTLSSIFSQNSKHIVKYYHSWIEEEKIYIVMEYCQSSLKELYQFYKSQKKIIEEQKLKQVLKQALIGLKSMHDLNMVHLDIKPDNLLFKFGQIKIADLGLCRITRIKRWSDLDQGDTRYLAKELLNYHEGVDLKKADIYSLGMSIFQGTILEDLPNNGYQWLSIRQNGINLKQVAQIKNYSEHLQEIIAQMIQPCWQNRPTCEMLLANKYFSDEKNPRVSRFLRINGKSSRKQQGSL